MTNYLLKSRLITRCVLLVAMVVKECLDPTRSISDVHNVKLKPACFIGVDLRMIKNGIPTIVTIAIFGLIEFVVMVQDGIKVVKHQPDLNILALSVVDYIYYLRL